MFSEDPLDIVDEVILHEVSYGYVDAHCNVSAGLADNVTDELYGHLENAHVDAVDKTCFLGYGNEIGRAYVIAGVILHARKSFKAP